MRKLRFAAAIVALLSLPALARTRRAPVEGVLDGVVLNSKGAPVAAAQIFWQTADGKAPHALRANASGQFRIDGLRQGLYEVRAQSSGMTSDWQHNVYVPAGREASVTLRLVHRIAAAGSGKS